MSDRIDRRSFLARGAATGAGIAVVGTSGGLLDACSSGSSSSSSSTSGSTGTHPDGVTTATPKPGGSLVFGVDAEEKGFSPTQGTFDEVGVLYARTVFDPLMILDATGQPQPYLAESVMPNADYTVWTITLRPNLVFHNGSTCDATAVAANFTAQQASSLTGPALTNLRSIAVTSPLEVTLTMKAPWVPFDYYLTGGIGGQFAYVAEPKWLASGSQTDPIGTGPFVFQEWVPNDHFTATKNPHYWRPGLPLLDSITYKPIPDPDQLLASLNSGVVDIMHTDTPNDILTIRADTSLGYIDDTKNVAGEPDMGCLLLNLSKPPFDNLKVRQATAYAISSAQYVKVIDQGVNATSNGPFTTTSPYYVADNGYPVYNVDKAKALVTEVQSETGQPVSVTLNHTPDPSTTKDAEYLQQQLEQVGMKVTLSPVQQAQIINVALLGTFQAQLWRQFGAVDPDLNYIFWSPTNINSVFSINMARNTDPQMETALFEGPRVVQHGRPYRGVPGSQPADGRRHPLHLVRPDHLGHRRSSSCAELRRPHHTGGCQSIRPDRRVHLADPDLAQFLSTRPTCLSGAERPCHDRTMSRILIVEDDERIRSSMRLALEDEGYAVQDVASGEEAVAEFEEAPAELVLIDLMLPGIDGFETCRALRRHSTVPIIMVTARSDTHDVVAGLEAGADDYVTKPFVAKELAARIRALLRRSRPEHVGDTVITFGDVEIEPEAGEVRRGGQEVHCTRTEFRLLCELADHPGKVLSREHLLEQVWGYDYFGDGRLVDVHVRRLRTKIEPDPANPRFILTVRGMGYKLAV